MSRNQSDEVIGQFNCPNCNLTLIVSIRDHHGTTLTQMPIPMQMRILMRTQIQTAIAAMTNAMTKKFVNATIMNATAGMKPNAGDATAAMIQI